MATPATRESYEFSITVRPGDTTGMDRYEQVFMNWIDEQCTHYCVATEQKGDKSTEHYQVACVFKLPRRADNVKKSLISLIGTTWSKDQLLRAVCVKKNREENDIKLLAGGYCQKQDTTPRLKGWTTEELEPYINEYETLRSKADLRNIPAERIVKVLKGFHDEMYDNANPDVRDNFMCKTQSDRIRTTIQYAIANGAQLHKYCTPQWLNYFNMNYNVLFMNKSASDMLRELSKPRI